MPSAYTAMIEEDDGCTFEEFAWKCARAMGATILMRDEPLDTHIEDEKLADIGYYEKQLDERQNRLDCFLKLSEEELINRYDEYVKEISDSNQKRLERYKTLKNRYTEMKDKITKWSPPTTNHDGFKKFMLDQVDQSWPQIYTQTIEAFEDWKRSTVSHLEHDISWSKLYKEEELVRQKERLQWVEDLRKSIPQPGK